MQRSAVAALHIPPLSTCICVPDTILFLMCVLQVNSETDFVARNDQFVGMVGQVAAAALHVPASGRQGADSDAIASQLCLNHTAECL